jgi:hypothetical protein
VATSPTFTGTPRSGVAAVSAANTARDGTGTIVDLLTGVAAGTKVLEVRVQATVTTTAGMVRIFYYNGTTSFLVDEIPVTAITVGASTAGFEAVRTYSNLILAAATHKLQASTHNAENFNVLVSAGDLT